MKTIKLLLLTVFCFTLFNTNAQGVDFKHGSGLSYSIFLNKSYVDANPEALPSVTYMFRIDKRIDWKSSYGLAAYPSALIAFVYNTAMGGEGAYLLELPLFIQYNYGFLANKPSRRSRSKVGFFAGAGLTAAMFGGADNSFVQTDYSGGSFSGKYIGPAVNGGMSFKFRGKAITLMSRLSANPISKKMAFGLTGLYNL